MKKYFKLFLDLLMGVIFVLLMNLSFTGLVFHEIAGIFIFVAFITHIILNKKWVKAVGKNFTNNKLKSREKVMFVLNAVMFLVCFCNYYFSSIVYSTFKICWK